MKWKNADKSKRGVKIQSIEFHYGPLGAKLDDATGELLRTAAEMLDSFNQLKRDMRALAFVGTVIAVGVWILVFR
jgi:hypothetical protein